MFRLYPKLKTAFYLMAKLRAIFRNKKPRREKGRGKQGERPNLCGRKVVPLRFTAGGENIHGDRQKCS